MDAKWIGPLLGSLPAAAGTAEVRVGALLTAVVAVSGGRRSCGLASTLRETRGGAAEAVRQAGALHEQNPLALARLLRSESPTEASIGMAAVNALLGLRAGSTRAWRPDAWQGINAADLLSRLGRHRSVALVGHFPFALRLRDRVEKLWVLELNPSPGDLPAAAAPEIVPCADVLALTSMTLVNGTFDGLVRLRKAGAVTVVLGPGAPLSPVLFDHGADIIAGAEVEEIEGVLACVSQGANFRQALSAGARLVTMGARHMFPPLEPGDSK